MMQPQDIFIQVPVILFSLTVHEFSHAFSAHLLGDDTAKNAGRMSLNPIRHLDIVGALLFIFAGFGWAKPVPVNPYNCRNPKRDDVLIAFSGPASNIIAAVLSAAVFITLTIIGVQQEGVGGFAYRMSFISVAINSLLAVFNLIPLFPLDGSHVLEGLLPNELSRIYSSTKGFHFILVIIFIVFLNETNIFNKVIGAFIYILVMLPLDKITPLIGS